MLGIRDLVGQITKQGSALYPTKDEFQNTRASLKSYLIPDWFADAKFGIWSHWGPQSAVGDGDWYARNMYIEGRPQYDYHIKRFGPQSKVGYKDTIPLFTADRWDPDHLIDLYVKAGAKYFFSMGVHHDNYDLWDSKFQPHWNSVNTGPKKDIVGMWAAAARKRGLRFGVSEHLSNSFDWLAPSHLSDSKGPFAGVPYDGTDPRFADLYHSYADEPADFAKDAGAMSRAAPDSWKLQYSRRIRDLVDQHQPDLLYTDGGIPFERYGLDTVAELYNVGPKSYRGTAEGVYFSKQVDDCSKGSCPSKVDDCADGRTCVLDRERGVVDTIWPFPWQTDTCIGQWHYKVGQKYKSAKTVIDLLVDIVSKNGNLLLNFPLPASGELDAEEMQILEGITHWMAVNREAIYATRPWKICGEGPAMRVDVPTGAFNESQKPDLGPEDFRFTTKGETLYVFVQGWPQNELVVRALAIGGVQMPAKAIDVRILGRDIPLKFAQDRNGLRVEMPADKPSTADIGIALRVRFV
jgi:alpha-L-fucosidase